MAARIAELAVPDEILTDNTLRNSVGPAQNRLVFETAGRRMLKGFDEPVMLYSVSRP